MPFVIIDRRVDNNPNYDTVMLDNVSAAYNLTKHMPWSKAASVWWAFSVTPVPPALTVAKVLKQAIREAGLEHYSAHFIAPRIEQGYQST